MKDYFSHDYYSRNDPKMVKLFMKHGLAGIGAFWCVVEMLYEEGGYLLLTEYERITFELRTSENVIQYLIHESDLFINDGVKFWSETCIERLNKRADKSLKARESIEKRWGKYKRNTNVSETKNEGNTIKVKESKEKDSKENSYKKMLLSEIDISDFTHLKSEYVDSAKAFQLLFKSNLKEAGASTISIDKAKGTCIDDIRLMIENDKYTIEDLRAVYKFLQNDVFWKQNILSTSKLRQQMPKLKLKIHNGNGTNRSTNKEATSWNELAEIVHNAFSE